MRNAWLACCLLIMATAAGLAGCSRGGVQAGHAFTHDFPVSTGTKPIRPGTEIGLLDLYLDNGSSSTVVINSIGISGPGAGTVIRPAKVEIAPLRFGRRNYETNAVPSALYSTDPPVFFYGRKCHKQALFPVKGYRMTPGSQVRSGSCSMRCGRESGSYPTTSSTMPPTGPAIARSYRCANTGR